MILIAGYVLSQTWNVNMLDSLELWLADVKKASETVVALLLLLLVIRIGRWIHKADVVLFTPH